MTGTLMGITSIVNTFPRFEPIEGYLQWLGIGISLLWMTVISTDILGISFLKQNK